jgi:antitoxin CcdA
MTKEMDDPAKPFRHSGRIGKGSKPGPKKAVNLSVDAEILAAAKAQGINLSQVLEDELRERTKEERIKRFQEQHREAFEEHNRFIEQHGIWSEKYRSWGKSK